MPLFADFPSEILRILCQFIPTEDVARLFAAHDVRLCGKLSSPGVLPLLTLKDVKSSRSHLVRSLTHMKGLQLGLFSDTSLEEAQPTPFAQPNPGALISHRVLLQIHGAHLDNLSFDEDMVLAPWKGETCYSGADTFASLFPVLRSLKIGVPAPNRAVMKDSLLSQLHKALPSGLETLVLKGVANWPLLTSLPPSLTTLAVGRGDMLHTYHEGGTTIALLTRLHKQLPALVSLDLEISASTTESGLIQQPMAFSFGHSPSPAVTTAVVEGPADDSLMFPSLARFVIRGATPLKWQYLNLLWPKLPTLTTLHVHNFVPNDKGNCHFPSRLEALLFGYCDAPLSTSFFRYLPVTVKTLEIVKVRFTPAGDSRDQQQGTWTPGLVNVFATPEQLALAIPRSVTDLSMMLGTTVSLQHLPPSLEVLRLQAAIGAQAIEQPIPCQLSTLRSQSLSLSPKDISCLPRSLVRISVKAPHPNPWTQYDVKALVDHLPLCHSIEIIPNAIFVGSPPDRIHGSLDGSSDRSHPQVFDLSRDIAAMFKERAHHLRMSWTVEIPTAPQTPPTGLAFGAPNPSAESFSNAVSSMVPLKFDEHTRSVIITHPLNGFISAEHLAFMVRDAHNLEILQSMFTTSGVLDFSVLTPMSKLVTLLLATEVSKLDFKLLPRTLTELRTRRLDMRPAANLSGPYTVGSIKHCTLPSLPKNVTPSPFGAATNPFASGYVAPGTQPGSEIASATSSSPTPPNDDTFSLNRHVIDLPRGLTRLNISTAVLVPQPDGDWPPNLHELRFASNGWDEVSLLSLKNHLKHLTLGSVHGVVEYIGSLHRDEKVFELSKVERLVRSSVAPFFVDTVAVAARPIDLLPPSITSLTFAEYEQDMHMHQSVSKGAPFDESLHFAVSRMLSLYAARVVRVHSKAHLIGKPFRLKVSIHLDIASFGYFEHLTTLNLPMIDCGLEHIKMMPRTLTDLWMVADVSSTKDLVAVLPPALTRLSFASRIQLNLCTASMSLLPPQLTSLHGENMNLIPNVMGAFPRRIVELTFNGCTLWTDQDVYHFSKLLDSEGRLRKLTVFNALLTGALLPSDTTELTTFQLRELTKCALGPKISAHLDLVSAKLNLSHLESLALLDLSELRLGGIWRLSGALPSSLTSLSLRLDEPIQTAVLRQVFPPSLSALHLYLENVDIDSIDELWPSLPRRLQTFSIRLVRATPSGPMGHLDTASDSGALFLPTRFSSSNTTLEHFLGSRYAYSKQLKGIPRTLKSFVAPFLVLHPQGIRSAFGPDLELLRVCSFYPARTESDLDSLPPNCEMSLVTSKITLPSQNMLPKICNNLTDAEIPKGGAFILDTTSSTIMEEIPSSSGFSFGSMTGTTTFGSFGNFGGPSEFLPTTMARPTTKRR